MGKFITITDLAKQLGISHSTVSRALADNPRISAHTKKRVRDLAKELGYQKNSTSHQLSKGKSQIIAVILPDLSIQFFSKVLEGINFVLRDSPYSILLFNTSESIDSEIKAIESCLKHRADGVLAAISMQTKSFEHFEKLIRHEVPLVFFDRVANFLPVPKVIVNDYQASFNATNYLIESGCKQIAHITGSKNLNNSNNRLYGYLDALTGKGIEINEKLIHYYDLKPASVDRFINQLILNFPNLDGLFVFNDYLANYAINLLKNLGKSIPNDISVIGFSDEPVATYMSPQLSTVEQIAHKMGALASQKIISILKHNEPVLDEKIIINPNLVLRETTNPIE